MVDTPTRRGALLRLAIAACSILASLALAEGFVRTFYPHVRDHVVPGRLFEIDQQLGWRLRPKARSVHRSRYFRAEYAINELGFRDRERHLEKPDATRRVLLYGDSQVFGWGVPVERRFSNLVESRLEGLEIWNLAVPGYGLDQEILSYEQSGDRFDADAVILQISSATRTRLPYAHIYNKNKPRFELDADGRARLVPIRGGPNLLTRLSYETLSSFYLPYFVERRLKAARQARSRRSGGGAPSAVPPVEPDALEHAILERATERARAAGHRLTLLVSMPPGSAPSDHDFETFASSRGIGYVGIDVPVEDGYILGPEDRHWSEPAHALVAEQIVAALAGPEPGNNEDRASVDGGPSERHSEPRLP